MLKKKIVLCLPQIIPDNSTITWIVLSFFFKYSCANFFNSLVYSGSWRTFRTKSVIDQFFIFFEMRKYFVHMSYFHSVICKLFAISKMVSAAFFWSMKQNYTAASCLLKSNIKKNAEQAKMLLRKIKALWPNIIFLSDSTESTKYRMTCLTTWGRLGAT